MSQSVLFNVFAEEYLNICKKSSTYKESLQNAVNHLQRFSDASQTPIFTDMNEQVIEDFVCYLQNQNLMASTIKNNINRIKYLLKKAHRFGYEVDSIIEDFNVPDEESNAIFFDNARGLQNTPVYKFNDTAGRDKRLFYHWMFDSPQVFRLLPSKP